MKRINEQKKKKWAGQWPERCCAEIIFFLSLSHLTESPHIKSFTAIVCQVPMFFFLVVFAAAIEETNNCICTVCCSNKYRLSHWTSWPMFVYGTERRHQQSYSYCTLGQFALTMRTDTMYTKSYLYKLKQKQLTIFGHKRFFRTSRAFTIFSSNRRMQNKRYYKPHTSHTDLISLCIKWVSCLRLD